MQEVKNAMKRTKKDKAVVVDEVGPELLRADMEVSASRLSWLYKKLWNAEKWPKVWKQGLVVKIFKNGDLRDCNNWRGVTLLPVINKVFYRMLLERIKEGVDKKLRKEQTGFRRKRSTTEHIFTLRNFLERSKKWITVLYTDFVDYKKPLIRFTEKACGES